MLMLTLLFGNGGCRESSIDLTTILGAMYAVILFAGFNNASTVQPVVAIERTVFYRERAAGMYSALSYAFAQVKKPGTWLFQLPIRFQVLGLSSN